MSQAKLASAVLCLDIIFVLLLPLAHAQEKKNLRIVFVSLSWNNLFSPGYAADLSLAQDGIQIMLDEDIRAGVVDKKFSLDRVINDRILKQTQQELRSEGRLR